MIPTHAPRDRRDRSPRRQLVLGLALRLALEAVQHVGLGLVVSIALLAVAGCSSQAPSQITRPTRPPIAPIVQIDDSWTAIGGQWTFTGYLDPEGYASDVVLEVGEGSFNDVQIHGRVPVVQDVTEAGPITITTRQVQKVDQVCVRFAATSVVGSSESKPLCFPYSPPTAHPPGRPSVEIDPTFTAAAGSWTFSASIDPNFSPTDVVLEVGRGPKSSPTFTSKLTVSKGVTATATVSFTTKEIPEVSTVCVRFTATNKVGAASSKPLCFPRSASS